MKIRAVLFGATGMVGEGVLHEALNHNDVESILVIGRKTCTVGNPKLKEILHGDFFDYANIEQGLRGYDACFFCLGVSSVGMNETEYRRITYNLTMEAAKTMLSANPGMTFCYVSGMGTDGTEAGPWMWARVKGKTENDLMKLPFKSVYLFRPGFIKPTTGLHNASALSKAIGLIYPLWRLIAPAYVCTLEDLGTAMIRAVTRGYPKQILENRDIAQLARSHPGGHAEL
jgi:uncharacterized protein YbjT (DUF2867 family)